MQPGRVSFLCGILCVFLSVILGLGQQPRLSVSSLGIKKLNVPSRGHTGFKEIAAVKHGLTPKEEYSRPENHPIREMGNMGLAVGDVDRHAVVAIDLVDRTCGPNGGV